MLVLIVALLAGVLAGYALGGRLRNLEHLHLRLPWVVVLALGIQLVIFSPLRGPLGETAILTAHVASYALLLAFVVANRRRLGVLLAGAGTVANAAVIVANGGYMPASRSALEFAGMAVEADPHNNSTVADEAAQLAALGDVMAVPDWIPWIANVFSIGDVLIAAGVAVVLAAAMRTPGGARTAAIRAPGGEPEAS